MLLHGDFGLRVNHNNLKIIDVFFQRRVSRPQILTCLSCSLSVVTQQCFVSLWINLNISEVERKAYSFAAIYEYFSPFFVEFFNDHDVILLSWTMFHIGFVLLFF